jgi:hypothetical protein
MILLNILQIRSNQPSHKERVNKIFSNLLTPEGEELLEKVTYVDKKKFLDYLIAKSIQEDNEDENTWMIRRSFFREWLFSCSLKKIIMYAMNMKEKL